ncbi:MAG: hypothetical protein Q9M32_05235 [Sulfurimonas sp.]|nr:hypothetical protein [Sulfurimonas sp.]MDQ7062459.1 hypothetical protein [Sulfurimonas sp.]
MKYADIPLHDIKPIMIVDEYSLYFFIASVLLALVVFIATFYAVFYLYKKSKIVSTRKRYKMMIESLNLEDTKNTAYAISTYGALFKDDSPRHQEMFENISQRLAAYKYKKDVENFDDETLGYIEIYKSMLDV